MLLAELAHVKPDVVVGRTKDQFRDCFGQFRLADTGGPREKENALGPLRMS